MFNKTLLSLFAVIIGFLAGFLLSSYFYSNKEVIHSLNDCKEVALKRLAETGYIEPERLSPQNIKLISGTVKSLNNNSIVLSIKPLSPLSDPNLDERRIMISETTEIIKTVIKDTSEYKNEMEEFNAKGRKTSTDSDAPFFYKNINIGFKELSVGDRISVQSVNNIEYVKEIVAEKIIVK